MLKYCVILEFERTRTIFSKNICVPFKIYVYAIGQILLVYLNGYGMHMLQVFNLKHARVYISSHSKEFTGL